METTGQRFKMIRIDQNLAQEDFGRKIGLSKSAVSAVENDKSFISIEIQRTLFMDYNINLNWLVTGTGSMYINICENTHSFIKNEKPQNNIKNWGKRLSQILSDAQETPYSFSKRTKIKESRIEQFILDSAMPTIDELTAIKSNVDISIDELLYSEIVENKAQAENVSLSQDEILKIKNLLKSGLF